jgi:hypothetical protein
MKKSFDSQRLEWALQVPPELGARVAQGTGSTQSSTTDYNAGFVVSITVPASRAPSSKGASIRPCDRQDALQCGRNLLHVVQSHALVATGLTGVKRNAGFRQAAGCGNEGEQRRIGATIDGRCIEPDLETVTEEACKFRARRTRLDTNVE